MGDPAAGDAAASLFMIHTVVAMRRVSRLPIAPKGVIANCVAFLPG